MPGSRIGRLIVALNLLGLAILVAGALILNELRRGLVDARIDSLTTQGELIANVIAGYATRGSPEPSLEADRASEFLEQLFIPKSQRARLFDKNGALLADSYLIADVVEVGKLPPARKPGSSPRRADSDKRDPKVSAAAKGALDQEVQKALRGDTVAGMRVGPDGRRVVSVSIPIERVQAVLGVLTLEAGDVGAIIAAERRALLPFILMAVAATLISSLLLSRLIVQPVLRLARAADSVRLSRARSISLPDLSSRRDELGDLANALEGMTGALSMRMDAIERFAADVAHEIRNPLTSIRSAVDTLPLVADPAARTRLLAILGQDVGRLDRLVTDISNASRLDAELSREPPRPLNLDRLLDDIANFYNAGARPGEPPVRFIDPTLLDPIEILGREGPLSQVFRNLIDNARSFSPPGGEVRLTLSRIGRNAVAAVEDDGPGLPPENLETVFERFYTSRPKGAAFGGNSGLGLSIARQIVEAHGGLIVAENRLAHDQTIAGARFLVSLPESRL